MNPAWEAATPPSYPQAQLVSRYAGRNYVRKLRSNREPLRPLAPLHQWLVREEQQKDLYELAKR